MGMLTTHIFETLCTLIGASAHEANYLGTLSKTAHLNLYFYFSLGESIVGFPL